MIPKVIPATLKTSGTPTVKTNNPRRIIHTILKTSLASFILISAPSHAPNFFGFIVRSQVYEDTPDSVPLKIPHCLSDKMFIC